MTPAPPNRLDRLPGGRPGSPSQRPNGGPSIGGRPASSRTRPALGYGGGNDLRGDVWAGPVRGKKELSFLEIRTLVLMRHAQSAHPGGVRDHDRPLTTGGRAAAGGAGEWLRKHLGPVEEILCSTALRAQQTALATGTAAPVRSASEVYDATADDILSVLRTTGEHVRTLLVVGHAPGIPALTAQLMTVDGEKAVAEGDELPDELRVRFPTAAMAVLQFEGDWAALDDGAARLISFRIPPA